MNAGKLLTRHKNELVELAFSMNAACCYEMGLRAQELLVATDNVYNTFAEEGVENVDVELT